MIGFTFSLLLPLSYTVFAASSLAGSVVRVEPSLILIRFTTAATTVYTHCLSRAPRADTSETSTNAIHAGDVSDFPFSFPLLCWAAKYFRTTGEIQ